MKLTPASFTAVPRPHTGPFPAGLIVLSPTTGCPGSSEKVSALAKTLGGSEQEAVDRLDHEAAQQRELAAADEQGITTDGAFFTKAGTLTVNAPDAKAVKQARVGVSSWSVDLASDTVTVEVNSDSGTAARSFIKAAAKHDDAVRVVRGQERLNTTS
ncbi:alpha-lytic protease prodomain-containing protein [Streptomyces sp. NBC_01508]|uniref:alpha-lytic protease prodomain-containing protein n=1 Tax=Streptomyces sp. NBC_01508 TaxID=2903888 RepID=UPI00386C21D6